MTVALLLLVVSSIAIGAFSVALIARGNGLWVATGSWSSASGNLFVRERLYTWHIGSWYPFVRLRFRYWVRSPEYRAALAKEVRELLHTQGVDGTWNYSSYQHGMYNGLEVALALLEQREAQFRNPPMQWICNEDQDDPAAKILETCMLEEDEIALLKCLKPR